MNNIVEPKQQMKAKPLTDLKKRENPVRKEAQDRAMKMASYLKRNSLVPSSFKNDSQLYMAIMVALDHGYDTFGRVHSAIKNMYVINDTVSMFGELPLAIVMRSGKLSRIHEYFVNEEGNRIRSNDETVKTKPYACVCKLERVDLLDSEAEFILTRDDLIKSGGKYDEKNDTFTFIKGYKRTASETWLKYPKIHWMRRTRAFALKSVFPDILLGVHIQEHDGLAKAHSINSKGKMIPEKEVKEIVDEYTEEGDNEETKEGS